MSSCSVVTFTAQGHRERIGRQAHWLKSLKAGTVRCRAFATLMEGLNAGPCTKNKKISLEICLSLLLTCSFKLSIANRGGMLKDHRQRVHKRQHLEHRQHVEQRHYEKRQHFESRQHLIQRSLEARPLKPILQVNGFLKCYCPWSVIELLRTT